MRTGIVAHTEYVEPNKIERLLGLDFVFVSIDDNKTKQWLFPALQTGKVAFIDVGMGIEKIDEKLLGIIRTSLSTPEEGLYTPQAQKIQAEMVQQERGEYERNVQIVELNALNAASCGNPVEKT